MKQPLSLWLIRWIACHSGQSSAVVMLSTAKASARANHGPGRLAETQRDERPTVLEAQSVRARGTPHSDGR